MEGKEPRQWGVQEDLFVKAAEALSKASFLSIGAGAGMSADSGLAVYGDVSNTPFFKKRGLTYRDVSDPRLLAKNPGLFFAWAGTNLQTYRNHQPHKGYTILKNMCSNLFETSSTQIQSTIKLSLNNEISTNPLRSNLNSSQNDKHELYHILTTNVDGYFHDIGFPTSSICQTHGTYFKYQCSGLRKPDSSTPPFQLFDGVCCKKVWDVPEDYEMLVDYGKNGDEMNAPGNAEPKNKSKIDGFQTNHPLCVDCGRLARPNVYHFGDSWFVENEKEEENRVNWSHAVKNLLNGPNDYFLVMLEIGVGMRLPKIRTAFERLLKDVPKGKALIIRINPEESKAELTPGVDKNFVITLHCGALYGLEKIQEHLLKLQSQSD